MYTWDNSNEEEEEEEKLWFGLCFLATPFVFVLYKERDRKGRDFSG